jgi:uncharacterized membrane protein HdeD (DUF308 family)
MHALTERDDNILNGTTAILGLILLLCPWLLGFETTRSASWTAGTGGLVIAVISAAALTQRAEWHEWVDLAAGLGLVASPWLFGFMDVTTAAVIHVVLGGLVAALAAVEIWRFHSTPPAKPA